MAKKHRPKILKIMKKTIILLLILPILNFTLKAQTNDTQEVLYNIGFGAILGGVGAVINKKKDEKLSDILLKGMGQGALGGHLIFESKRLIREFNRTDNFAYVWPSRLLNSAGNSILENAASNQNFYERWHLHIGFNRLELNTTGRWKLNYRFMPIHFGTFLRASTQGSLDLATSLKTGEFVFLSERPLKSNNSFEENLVFDGRAIGNSIVLLKNAEDKNSILTHELIHVYQNDSFIVLNPYINVTLERILQEKEWYKGFGKYIYLDFNYFYLNGIYRIDSRIKQSYKIFFLNKKRIIIQTKKKATIDN